MRWIYFMAFVFAVFRAAPAVASVVGPRADMGGMDSGGGKAVVCRTWEGKISSATLLDLFEGQYLFHRPPLASREGFLAQLKEVAARFRSIDYIAFYASYAHLDSEALELFSSAIKVPGGIRLEPTDDAIPVIVPVGCGLEQAAIYNSRIDRLVLSSEIWDSFDETNRAALLLHEAIYDKLRRNSDETDSFYTRQVVSFVMSRDKLQSLVEGVPADAYLCQSSTGPSPGWTEHEANSAFYLYQSQPGSAWHFQWMLVNRLPIFVPFSETEDPASLPASPSTDQLAGADRYSGMAFEAFWSGAPRRDLEVNPGWISSVRVSFDPNGGDSLIHMEVGFHRSGESEERTRYLPVVCWPKP
jgi:hypothetical protein